MSSGMTPRQSEAVNSIDDSVFVAAGAGTGKTRVLVNRYLELLRSRRASVYRVAAVTYTEKAAKEMKDRIRLACRSQEESAGDDESRRFWYAQRVALENGYIGTIHSLCASILRVCPIEVGIDPMFAILDETQSVLMRRKVIDQVLAEFLDAEDVDLIYLMRLFGREGLARRLGVLFQKRPRALDATRRAIEAPGELARRFAETMEQENRAIVRRILDDPAFSRVFSVLADLVALDAKDKLEQERRRLMALHEQLARQEEPEGVLDLLRQMTPAAVGRFGSKKSWPEGYLDAVRDAIKELGGLLGQLPEPFDEVARKRLDEELDAGARLSKVFRGVEQTYRQAKTEAGVLDFDDLLLETRRFLMTNAAGRRRLQQKFDYLLVDELQDTSFLERDIVCLLAADDPACEEPACTRPVSGKLFVVGDDKQSIYRFRGSEVTVFGDFRDRIGKSGKVVELDRNFRTVAEGVAFANTLFSRLMPVDAKRLPFESAYVPLEPVRSAGGAFVEVLAAECEDKTLMPRRRAAEAELIADRIERLVRDGELVVQRSGGTASPVRYGDITILFRALTSARTYEEALRDAGIPYYLVAGSGFYAAQEVRDVLNCLKVLERQTDALALVGTLRSSLFGLSDEVIFLMSRAGSLDAALAEPSAVEGLSPHQREQVTRAAQVLGDLRERRSRMGLAQLVQDVIRRTGFDAVLLGQFMGQQKLANLEKLIDQARNFEAGSRFTLDDFIEYMDEFVRSEARESQRAAEEEEENVVKLMSIHRAKGLEFPVVFLADMSRRDLPGREDLVLDPELGPALKAPSDDPREDGPLFSYLKREAKARDAAEDLRLLYVALTRARDRLFLCGSLCAGRSERETWLARLLQVMGLEQVEDGAAFELVPGCIIKVATRPSGSVSSQEGQASQAGWLGARRLERFAPSKDSVDSLPEGLAVRLDEVAPDFSGLRQFTVTQLLTFADCPRRYSLEHVLHLAPEITFGPTRGRGQLGALIGTVVHRVLALWDLRSGDLLPDLARRAVTELVDVSRAQGASILRETLAILSRALDAGLLEPLLKGVRCQSEAPFVLRVGDNLVEGIIDRLLIFEDGSCEVVDYKTNQVAGDDLVSAAEVYRFQVGLYALAASRAIGPVRRASVLFLSAGQQVQWELEPDVLDDVSRRLETCVQEIQSGRFQPRTGGCHRCGFAFACKEGNCRDAGRASELEA